MDPMLMVIAKELAPVLACVACFAAPVAWYWIKKSHELRAKELDIENDARVHALEKRLAAAEALLAAQGLQLPERRTPERPELFEAPPQPVRTR
jgi:hypothetical protein